MPKIILIYRSNGRRQLGRPSKRLLDQVETGLSRPNSRRMMMMMVTMMNILRPTNLLFSGYQGLFPRGAVFCWLMITKYNQRSRGESSEQCYKGCAMEKTWWLRAAQPVWMALYWRDWSIFYYILFYCLMLYISFCCTFCV